MALPSSYNCYDKYFSDVISFLKSNSFLVNTSNVQILSKNILRNMPKSWIHYVSINSLENVSHLSTIEDKGPFSEFFQQLNALSPNINKTFLDELNNETSDDTKFLPGLSVKKQHEISQFSEVIYTKMVENNITHVIDLGSGLGYLCQMLHSIYGVSVLGVEADVKKLQAAKIRQEKYCSQSKPFVKYVQHFVTEESDSYLEKSMVEAFSENDDFFLVGLHACGDLSINAIKCFLKMKRCKGLLIMPCCYHKMMVSKSNVNISKESTQCFVNFPLSDSLKNCDIIFQQPFLRLACQRSMGGWNLSCQDNHRLRIFHLMCRATLELYASRENCRLIKHGKRKVFNKTLAANDHFKEFLKDGLSTFKLIIENNHKISDVGKSIGTTGGNFNNCIVPSSSKNSKIPSETNNSLTRELEKGKILCIWKELTPLDFKLATLYTVLQDSLQAICENLVLLDKLTYMEEQTSSEMKYGFFKITKETLSPRCLALIAEK